MSKEKVCEICGTSKDDDPRVGYCSAASKILCNKHRLQFMRHGSFLNLRKVKKEKECEVCGVTTNESSSIYYCSKANKMLCCKHLHQFLKFGSFLSYTKNDRNKFITYDTYAEIELRNRHGDIVGYAKIDLDDIERCRPHKWFLNCNDGYARTMINNKGETLHRYIVGYHGNDEIDHINRDKLDNRKCNLRVVSKSENSVNRKGWSSTGYTNIYNHIGGNFIVNICRDGTSIYCKVHKTLEEAIAARDNALSEYNKLHNRAC